MAIQMCEMAKASRKLEQCKIAVQLKLFSDEMAAKGKKITNYIKAHSLQMRIQISNHQTR